MGEDNFLIDDILVPYIIAEEKDYLIVFKPPRMHSAPLVKSEGRNIVEWCNKSFPEIMDLPGRKTGEGGLLHRLDFETQGLIIIARTKEGMNALLLQQSEGKIAKEYNALAAESLSYMVGFPAEKPKLPLIKSSYRSFGPGSKETRPVLGDTYTTEILENKSIADGLVSFRVRIVKGFRHQIRCHLAWLGQPILNDKIYGKISYGNGLLALRATSLSFFDPSSGQKRNYSIPQLEPHEI